MKPSEERAFDEFLALCEMDRAARDARLGELAAEDTGLALAVARMLEADGRGHRLLDGGVPAALVAGALARDGAHADATLPDSIGPYRVIARIGEGGAGLVLEVEQAFPRRRVALKLLRANVWSEERARRFRREIETLARLDHPGIARIHEAGTTPDGVAYFTMDLVRGRPLDEHVRRARLDLARRIDLIARVCDAVEHAHARGVVHRDLKPGNVLVDEDGAPRVLDFGIARIAGDDGSDATLRTEEGALIGTLAYMSPEQAAGDVEHIDGRSDVYSLGVLAYETFGGALPVTVRGLPLHEAVRAVCTQDPPALSTLDRALAGDLETVVHKALEKEPQHRYGSAAAFAADLRRVLASEPILARPATAFYRLAKLARRNRGLVAGVLAAFGALGVGLVLALWQANRATRASVEARQEARRAERLTYLASIQGADAALATGDVATARALLEAAPAVHRGFEWRYLDARTDASAAVFASGEPLLAVAYAGEPRGAEVLVFDASGVLARRTAGLDVELGRVTLPGGPFALASFDDDASTIVTATSEGDVVSHPIGGGPARSMGRVADALELVAAPGGETVVVLATRGRAFLARAGRDPRAIDVGGLHGAAFDGADGALLLGSADGAVVAADLSSGARRELQRSDPSDVRWIARSRDGRVIALGRADQGVLVLDRDTGAATGPFTGSSSLLLGVAVSDDGRSVATAGGDGVVRAWRLGSGGGAELFFGHEGHVRAVRFAPDGETLLSFGRDRTVRVWKRERDGRSSVLTGHRSWVYPVRFSPDGALLYSGAWDGDVRRWDGRSGAPLGVLASIGPDVPVLSLAVSPDAEFLALGRTRADTLLIRAATGAVVGELAGPPPRSAEALAFDAQGARIASFSFHGHYAPNRGRVDVFDVATRAHLAGWSVPSTGFGGVAFHPRREEVVVATGASVIAFDLAAGEQRASERGPSLAVSVAFSADGSVLATGHGNGLVVFRDPSSLAPRLELTGHHGSVYALAFSPDGSRLASGARDGQILLWDPADGRRLACLSGHENYVYSLAFSPCGERLASGSGDGTVRLWHAVKRRAR